MLTLLWQYERLLIKQLATRNTSGATWVVAIVAYWHRKLQEYRHQKSINGRWTNQVTGMRNVTYTALLA
ncbi:MAG: hypothetical protein O7F74_07635, partial [Bacteroidetes bacterium]|nr:hypothetical protein [Bacteroidota bacterium]